MIGYIIDIQIKWHIELKEKSSLSSALYYLERRRLKENIRREEINKS